MKKFLNRMKKGWLLFSRIIGRVSTIVLLTLVYVLVIGPMALGTKILRKDLLQRKKDSLKISYWHDRISNEPTVERHRFQF